MKLLTFKLEEKLKLGVKTEIGIIDVEKSLKSERKVDIPTSLAEVIQGGEEAVNQLSTYILNFLDNPDSSAVLNETEVEFGPSIYNPEKIICIGLNYSKHAEESNMPIPKYPILFNKFNNAIASNGEMIKLSNNAIEYDYEAELAIVIGKTASNIDKKEALNYVLGYCVANDLSARDLQFRTNQWLLGKSSDGFMPIGPYLVTRDEIENPNNLSISLSVNGELRQDSNTSDMIFHCDEIISYISNYMTLKPGDVIITGTPEGVILGYPEEQRVWLKKGDEMSVTIENLGTLTNKLD